MRANKLRLYVHVVWTTWDREPWITPGVERRLYRVIEAEFLDCEYTVLALNGGIDHAHALTEIVVTQRICDVIKQVKGASSRFVNAVLKPTIPFRWQPNYGAFTVGEYELDVVKAYIQQQKRHHADGTIIPVYEESTEEFFCEE